MSTLRVDCKDSVCVVKGAWANLHSSELGGSSPLASHDAIGQERVSG